jgi:hypothetical protein
MSKKNRLRDCPAAARSIEAFECGAGRHTVFACPEECPFNPFAAANYASFQQLELNADGKMFQWMSANVAKPGEFAALTQKLAGDSPNVAFFNHLAWQGVYRLDANGESCLGKWAKAGFPGLTHDEQVLMRGRMQMRVGLVEVHRILDRNRVEVVDLLDPEAKPFIIVDQAFAARVVRFAVYALDLVPLPNYTRIFGFGMLIPDLDSFAAEVAVRAVVAHLGGPSDNAGLRRWLAEHFEKFQQSLTASALARHRLMIDELDAQFGKVVYELLEPFDQCRAHLDAVPEVAADPISEQEQSEGFVNARCWFARKNDEEFDYVGEGAVLGRVLLGKTHWRLEVMGSARLDKLRARFESVLGPRVKFTGERRDNIGARMRMQLPEYDASLVPPLLLTEPPRLVSTFSRVPATADDANDGAEDFMRERDRVFLDQTVPALEGKTPRAAASIPALRPALLRLMKGRVNQCDTHNLETGGTEDVNWMLRELGLTEILFEPPPTRPRTRLSPEFEEES